jgi:hypothetical protein
MLTPQEFTNSRAPLPADDSACFPSANRSTGHHLFDFRRDFASLNGGKFSRLAIPLRNLCELSEAVKKPF